MLNKIKLLTLFCILAGTAIGYYGGKGMYSSNLEIYTAYDIIYVNGLKVTFESKDSTIVFPSRGELETYISDKTAEDTNKLIYEKENN